MNATFHFATWNVHMGLHNDGGRNDVVAKVAALDADVVALQEAWWYGDNPSDTSARREPGAHSDMVEQVAAAMGAQAHTYVSPGPHPRYPARWAVAILSRLPAQRLDDLVIPSNGVIERRGVRVRLENGLVVACMHLDGIHAMPNIGLAARQRSAFKNHTPRVDVLAGDLNLWATLINRDARPLRPAVTGRTWPSHRPHSQIDHVLISDRLVAIEGVVLPDMASDHRALSCRLALAGGPSSQLSVGRYETSAGDRPSEVAGAVE